MSHNHDTDHGEKGIKFGLVLNTLYTIVEFGFGIFTGSLALIADASHNLTDTLTLSISFVANRVARRKANDARSFGYGRATILAALLNSVIMLGVAGFIIFEAIQRLTHPQAIEGGLVALVALVGIAVNGSIAIVLYKQRSDLNMRSAFIDMAFDALSSLGAVIAGVVILLTGIQWADSVVGLLIAALLVYNTINILREALSILLEGTPSGINVEEVKNTILAVDKVLQVDDMHVWTIRSGYNALSCHIAISEEELPNSRKIVEAIKNKLLRDCNIQHVTIEVELEECVEHVTHENH